MTALTDVAGTIEGEPVSLHELLLDLKLGGNLQLIGSALTEAAVRRVLDQHNTEVSDYELQRAADMWRQSSGLHSAAETERWLAMHAMTVEELEMRLEREIRRRKVRDLVTSDLVGPYFEQHAQDFATASVAYAMTDDSYVAQQIRDSLGAPDPAFADILVKFARFLKEVRPDPKQYRRRDFNPMLASAVFAAKEGTILPPIEVGMEHYVFRVLALYPPTLDSTTRETIKDYLFDEWLASRLKTMKIDFLLPARLAVAHEEA